MNFKLLLFLPIVNAEYISVSTKYYNQQLFLTGSHPMEYYRECNGSPFTNTLNTIPDLRMKWPDSDYKSEWESYGKCTNMTEFDYFTKSIQVLDILNTSYLIDYSMNNTFINIDLLSNVFGGAGYSLIECDTSINTNLFVGLTTCWTPDLLLQVVCPYISNPFGSCGTNVSLIPFVNATTDVPNKVNNANTYNSINLYSKIYVTILTFLLILQ
jgi:hypothetical protein